jgi:hypothetical protein
MTYKNIFIFILLCILIIGSVSFVGWYAVTYLYFIWEGKIHHFNWLGGFLIANTCVGMVLIVVDWANTYFLNLLKKVIKECIKEMEVDKNKNMIEKS